MVIAKNPALARRFYNLQLQEPDEETTLSILQSSFRGVLGNLASDVVLTPGALSTVVRLARSDMPYLKSPAKEFRIVNSLVSSARMTPKTTQHKPKILKDSLQLLNATNYGDPLLEKSDIIKLQRDIRRLMQEVELNEATKSIDQSLLKLWEKSRGELGQLQTTLQKVITKSKKALKDTAKVEDLSKCALETYCIGAQVKEKEKEVRKNLDAVQTKSGPLITSEMAAEKVAELLWNSY